MHRSERTGASALPVTNEFGFEFVHQSGAKIEAVQTELDAVAAFLDVDPPILKAPDFGFLTRPLTQEQKHALDNRFEPDVAAFITEWENSIKPTPIVEMGERMVDLREVLVRGNATASFSERTFHPACGEWGNSPKVYWVRETIASKLLTASQALNYIGLAPNFEDGFRPEGVQEALFQRRVALVSEEHPDWEEDMVVIEALTKTAGSPWNAGHKAGAAVDMTLRTIDGLPLDLGNDYPDGGVIVTLDCPFVTFEQYRTRQVFAQTMRMVGMSVYPGEDWHVSYGDALAAMDSQECINYQTVYGPVKGFDSVTGEIDPYDPEEYYENFSVSP